MLDVLGSDPRTRTVACHCTPVGTVAVSSFAARLTENDPVLSNGATTSLGRIVVPPFVIAPARSNVTFPDAGVESAFK
jgi:hypothetical protein